MSHSTLNDSLVIYGNDGLWSPQEKDEIINRAVEIYLAKNNRRRKVDHQAKRQRLDEEASTTIEEQGQESESLSELSLSDRSDTDEDDSELSMSSSE